MNIQELFKLGMKRDIPRILAPEKGDYILDLGAGNNPVPGAIALDYPAWNATRDKIPAKDGKVDHIYAFHFLEHLAGEQAIALLREVERVLRPGGVFTCLMPHYSACLAYRDLDHKSFWSLETWRTLMFNQYYDKHRESRWNFTIHTNFIMGVEEPNLAMFTQLVRN